PDYKEALKTAGVKVSNLNINAPGLRVSGYDWSFQDTDNAELQHFRERFRLEEVIEQAADEMHAIRLLRNWVHMQDVWGGNDVSYMISGVDPEAMVLACNSGGWLHCTFYAILTAAVLQSMGWVARKIAGACESNVWNTNTHHGITEVWVNDLCKWVLLDSMFDTHYELDGIPLSGLELHRAAFEGRGPEVAIAKGPQGAYTDFNGFPELHRKDAPQEPASQADCYFWRYYALKHHSFTRQGTWDRGKTLLLTDEAHKGKTWLQGENEHSGYSGKFIETENIHDVYFDVNRVYLEPAEVNALHADTPHKNLVAFTVGTFTPNLDRLEISLDKGPWVPQHVFTRLAWPLHKGSNSFAVRTVNKMDKRGPVTELGAEIAE
ncbi:hypothetical protein ACFL4W_04295, partial [Planctomycetota bacterium]